MNLYTYDYDPQAAIAGDGGEFIKETGKYTGTFTKAQHIVTDKGTVGVDFEFKDDSGKQASFTLYTHSEQKGQIFGFNQLQAIMGCMRLKRLNEPQNRNAQVWDKQEKKRLLKPVPQFLELLDKPVGLLIVMEEYAANDGSYKWRPAFSHAFEAETELMASEIAQGKTAPERLGRAVATLADKPLKDKSNAPPAFASQQKSPPAYSHYNNYDDIPFNDAPNF